MNIAGPRLFGGTLTPPQKLAVARGAARKIWPWSASALLSLIPVVSPGLGTVAVTETAILPWDPEYVKKLTISQLAWLLLHNVSHLLHKHAARCRGARIDPELGNLCGCLAINSEFKRLNADLPEGTVYPHAFGLPELQTLEQYVALLRSRGYTTGEERLDSPRAGGGWCGSGGGRPLKNEAELPQDVGRSEASLQRMRRSVAEQINRAKGAGRIPGSLQRWAEQFVKPPVVPWQSVLQHTMHNGVGIAQGMQDYTYQRISRRQGLLGYGPGSPILPAFYAPKPSAVILFDLSASMSNHMIAAGVREVIGICKLLGIPLEFIAFDAKVQAEGRVADAQSLCKLLKGGGGTDFRPPFARWQQKHPRGSLAICITDGFDLGGLARPPHGYQTIWLLTGEGTRVPYPWGKAIRITDDRFELNAAQATERWF